MSPAGEAGVDAWVQTAVRGSRPRRANITRAFWRAHLAKERTRFDIARHKIPPRPVNRQPEAARPETADVAVVVCPTNNPAVPCCLKPSAMAVKNPRGCWIERFETAVCRKRVYDHHRVADDYL